MLSETLSLDIKRAYNVLISETNSKFSKRQAKTTFKTQQTILIYTEEKIYLDSPSKTPKFNCQPSKLPPHGDPHTVT